MSQNRDQASRLIFRPPAKNAPPIAPSVSDEERLRAAREKAADYRNPKPALPDDADKVQAIEEWADLVTKRIEEAMRRGDFDKLAGHGKPMRIEKDPFVPEDQQMAFQLLKDNNMSPTWIADRKAMLAAIEEWRKQFEHVVGQAHSAWVGASSDERRGQLQQSWERWLARWEDEIIELNRQINTLNLKQPITRLEIYKLRLNDELRKVGMGHTLDK